MNRRLGQIIRVSRRNDREGDSFMSPREQDSTNQSWARAHGDEIIKTFDESDSVSGKTVDREGLKEAIEMCRSGGLDGIIVSKVDRFSRDMIGGLLAVRELKAMKKSFIAAKHGIEITPDGDKSEDLMAKAMLNMLFMFAEWHLDSLTMGWETVRHDHIGRGVPNNEPYGYRKDGVRAPNGKLIGPRNLVPVDDERSWVKAMYEKRADGLAWGKIADWLVAEDVLTRNGGHWSINNVRDIVQSRVYLGEIRSGNIVNTEAHEPIVPLDLWNRANALNKTAQRREKAEFELTGIIRCSGCGVRMAGRGDHRKYGSYRYYTCRRRHSFGKCPAPSRIRADHVEAMVEEIFRERFLNPCLDNGCTAESSAETETLDAAEAALAEAEADLHAFLTSEATEEMRRTLGQSYVDDGMRFRVNRVAKAREAVAEARNAVLGVTFPMDLAEVWDSLDLEERRSFLADAIEVIAVRRAAFGDEPIEDRVRVWTRGAPGVPAVLPGMGGMSVLTPIPVDDAPAGSGETAA